MKNKGSFLHLATINSTIIVSNNSNKGLLYSEDNGKTWKESNIIINNN